MRIVIAQHATREEILFVTDAGDTELAKIIHQWETETARSLATEGATFVTRDVRCYAVAGVAGSISAVTSILERIKASAPAWYETIEGFVSETADYVQELMTRTGSVKKFPNTDEIVAMTPGERRIHLIALFKALGTKAEAMGLALTDDAVEAMLAHLVGDMDAVGDKIGRDGWRKLLGLGE